MREFLSHPLVADHKGTDMQSWYTRLRVYINQLFHGDNIAEGAGIYKESTVTGCTLSSVEAFTLANDVTTSGVALAMASLTGLAWTAKANAKYLFTFIGNVQPNTYTTGCAFAIQVGSGTPTMSLGFYHRSETAPFGGGDMTGGSSVADDTPFYASTSFPGGGAYPVVGHGWLNVGASDVTAQLRIGPEVNDTVTAKAGFTLIVTRITAV